MLKRKRKTYEGYHVQILTRIVCYAIYLCDNSNWTTLLYKYATCLCIGGKNDNVGVFFINIYLEKNVLRKGWMDDWSWKSRSKTYVMYICLGIVILHVSLQSHFGNMYRFRFSFLFGTKIYN